MSTPTDIVQAAYAAFGRRDIPAILELLTDDVEWVYQAGSTLPYGGRFSGKQEVQRWFGVLAQAEDIQDFQPREFLAGADHVTAIGTLRAKALPDGDMFESGWVQVFNFKGDKVSRWIGTSDTAASVAARK